MPKESIDAYYTRLRMLTVNCEFQLSQVESLCENVCEAITEDKTNSLKCFSERVR